MLLLDHPPLVPAKFIYGRFTKNNSRYYRHSLSLSKETYLFTRSLFLPRSRDVSDWLILTRENSKPSNNQSETPHVISMEFFRSNLRRVSLATEKLSTRSEASVPRGSVHSG